MSSHVPLTCPSCGQKPLKGPKGLHAHQLFHCPARDDAPLLSNFTSSHLPVEVVHIGQYHQPEGTSADEDPHMLNHEDGDSKMAPIRRSSRVRASSDAKRKYPTAPGNLQPPRKMPPDPLPPPPPRNSSLPFTLDPDDRRLKAVNQLLSTGHTIRCPSSAGINNFNDRQKLIFRIQEEEQANDHLQSFTPRQSRSPLSDSQSITSGEDQAKTLAALEPSFPTGGNYHTPTLPDYLYEGSDQSLDAPSLGNCSQAEDSLESEFSATNSCTLQPQIQTH
jgi:hypothetical protein